jgi:hypothetical protein
MANISLTKVFLYTPILIVLKKIFFFQKAFLTLHWKRADRFSEINSKHISFYFFQKISAQSTFILIVHFIY